MHLFVEYFRAKTRARQQEIDRAIQSNLRADYVSKMTLFCQDIEPAFESTHVALEVIHGPRQTYQSIIDYANRVAGPDDILAILNNDISLERGFERLQARMTPDQFIALSRRELSGFYGVNPGVSQDVWIWKGVCKLQNVDFFMGVRGCDNRVAAEAYLAGYAVSNPCQDLIVQHHHSSGERAGSYETDFVDPPYVMVTACKLGGTSSLFRMKGGEEWVREFRQQEERQFLADQVRQRLAG